MIPDRRNAPSLPGRRHRQAPDSPPGLGGRGSARFGCAESCSGWEELEEAGENSADVDEGDGGFGPDARRLEDVGGQDVPTDGGVDLK